MTNGSRVPKSGSSSFPSWVLAGCALAVTVLLVRQEFRPDSPSTPIRPAPEAIEVEDWESLADGGWGTGPVGAKITILEFGDFECPACSWFATRALRGVLAKYPEVRFVYRHWPLPYHRFALPAAIAAECSGDQGRFFEFADAVYSDPTRLGLQTFLSIAKEAGVEDTTAFLECQDNPERARARIDQDAAAAQSFSPRGTPAVIVNGLYLGGAPDSMALDSIVRSFLSSARGGLD